MKRTLIIVILTAVLATGIIWALNRKSSSGKILGLIPFGGDPEPLRDLSALPRGKFPLMLNVKSREVALYQAHLNQILDRAGRSAEHLEIDGIWGPITERVSRELHGWYTIDQAQYQVQIRDEEAQLIKYAMQTQKTQIAL